MTEVSKLHMAFGLCAMTVALKARTNQLRNRDKLQFAVSAMEWVRDHDAASAAAIDFLYQCQIDEVAAGEALHAFVLAQFPDLEADRPGQVLQEMQREFEWQKRADFR